MRVALAQFQPTLADKEANLSRMLAVLRRHEADLYVFPELILTGYLAKDAHRRLAEPADGPSVERLAKAAAERDALVVVGMPRVSETPGVIHNSAVLLDGEGALGHYDKVYLPSFSVFEEDQWFGEGRSLPVFGTPHGKLGLCICYDLFFPEITKTLALGGAETLVCISASPSISKDYFEAVMPARAIETTSFLLFANNVGPQDNLVFWGGSQAWSPFGEPLGRAKDFEEDVLLVELDKAEIPVARRKRPVLRDTRAEWFPGGATTATEATRATRSARAHGKKARPARRRRR